MAKNGNQINFKGNNRDNNQGIVKLTNYFDSKLGNVCGITMSAYVCMQLWWQMCVIDNWYWSTI